MLTTVYIAVRRSGFLSHVLRNFIEESIPHVTNMCNRRFLSHVLRNFIEEQPDAKPSNNSNAIPEPCAQELH